MEKFVHAKQSMFVYRQRENREIFSFCIFNRNKNALQTIYKKQCTLENNINTFIFIITIINPDAKTYRYKDKEKKRECVYTLY